MAAFCFLAYPFQQVIFQCHPSLQIREIGFVSQVRATTTFHGQVSGRVNLSRVSLRDSAQKRTSRVLLPHLGEARPFGRWGGSVRALDETKAEEITQNKEEAQDSSTSKESPVEGNGAVTLKEEDYPSGELEYQERGGWDGFVTKCRMLIAFPWQRVKKGSVLKLKLAGAVSARCCNRFNRFLSTTNGNEC